MYAGVVLGGMGSIIGAFWGGMTIGLVQQMSTLDTADATAERGDLRRLPPDHLLPPAGFLRAHGREDVTMRGIAIAAADPCLHRRCMRRLSLSVTNSLLPAGADAGSGLGGASACRGTCSADYTGLISFGHAAFFGIGAYAVALGQDLFLICRHGSSIPIAAVLGGVAGLLIGFPTFRLQGHYFALAMLAYPLAILYVFEWLGFQEVTAADQARQSDCLHAVRRSTSLHAAGAGDDARDDPADAG